MKSNSKSNIDEINKPNGAGLNRVIKATRCSILGLKAAYKHELAFRQELLLCALLLPLALIVAKSGIQLGLLLGSLIALLLVEIINSALEAVVDRIGIEHHELSGRAKDLGSAAVMLALFLVFVIWGCILFDNYLS